MRERFETFTVLISEISRYIYRIKAEEMAELELRGSHVNILYYLYKMESLTAKELSDVCGEDKANISRAVKHLEENGYLTGEDESGHKRYQTLLMLTEKGRETGKIIADKVDRVLEHASAGLTESDRDTMYRSLRLISGNLKEICRMYGADKEDKTE